MGIGAWGGTPVGGNSSFVGNKRRYDVTPAAMASAVRQAEDKLASHVGLTGSVLHYRELRGKVSHIDFVFSL
jgi:hypothetical protein